MNEMEKYYLFATLFATGATILMLEILGTRIIAPYFGTTLFVWSSLISVAIIALALGYFAGGFVADRHPKFSLLYIFIFTTAITLVLISKADGLILEATNGFGSQFGPLAASFALFSVPMFLLAMATPFAIKLKAEELETIGATAGNLYGISTLGSFFGAIATGFYLIPSIGTEATLFLFAGILIAIAGMHFLLQKTGRKAFVLLLVLLIPSYGMPIPENMQMLYKSESMYGQVKVIEGSIEGSPEMRFLLLDGAIQTCMIKETGKACTAYTAIIDAVLDLKQGERNALVIGLGGGTNAKSLQERNIEFDAVEIDPKIAFAAKEYFGFQGNAEIEDGRQFLKNSGKKYDFIIVDAFSAYSPPPHLFTKEMYETVNNSLKEEGILVVNSIGWAQEEKALLQKSIYKTLATVFEHVDFEETSPGQFGNVVFLASKEKMPITEKEMDIEGAVLLTDDYSPMESLSIEASKKSREITKENFEGMLTK
jgi:spermidine synthase